MLASSATSRGVSTNWPDNIQLAVRSREDNIRLAVRSQADNIRPVVRRHNAGTDRDNNCAVTDRYNNCNSAVRSRNRAVKSHNTTLMNQSSSSIVAPAMVVVPILGTPVVVQAAVEEFQL